MHQNTSMRRRRFLQVLGTGTALAAAPPLAAATLATIDKDSAPEGSTAETPQYNLDSLPDQIQFIHKSRPFTRFSDNKLYFTRDPHIHLNPLGLPDRPSCAKCTQFCLGCGTPICADLASRGVTCLNHPIYVYYPHRIRHHPDLNREEKRRFGALIDRHGRYQAWANAGKHALGRITKQECTNYWTSLADFLAEEIEYWAWHSRLGIVWKVRQWLNGSQTIYPTFYKWDKIERPAGYVRAHVWEHHRRGHLYAAIVRFASR